MSNLSKTWLFDLDGTVVEHNGYILYGEDRLLPEIKQHIDCINETDKIIILTSRSSIYKEMTINFLNDKKIKYDNIIFDLPHGERILVNDNKPSGYVTAYAECLNRNDGELKNIIKKYIKIKV